MYMYLIISLLQKINLLDSAILIDWLIHEQGASYQSRGEVNSENEMEKTLLSSVSNTYAMDCTVVASEKVLYCTLLVSYIYTV